ncbi:MAG: AAA family ATPase [Candidatus Nanoarchaeia archaeon]|nr:AAA family ATPase [Candidatus Nanoarchaeia archaeon]
MVGGVKGVGKSTLINEVLTIYKLNIFVFKGGEIMRNYLNLPNFDDFSSVSPELKKKAEKNMINIEKNLYKNKISFISDIHYSIELNSRYVSTLNKYNQLSDYCVIVVAQPEDILEFRKNDKKIRSLNLEKIIKNQKFELSIIESFCEKFKKELVIINNGYNSKKDNAILELYEIIKKI